MRAANLCGLIVLVFSFALLAPDITNGQPGGGAGKKSIFGGGGGDPNAIFDYLSKNRRFFLI